MGRRDRYRGHGARALARGVVLAMGLFSLCDGRARAQAPTWHYGVQYAGSFSTDGVLGEDFGLGFSSVDVDVAIEFGGDQDWVMEYTASAVPIAWVRNTLLSSIVVIPGRGIVTTGEGRKTTRGFGVRPLGLRTVIGRGTLGVYGETSLGVMRFGSPTPAANTAKLNFAATVGGGLRVRVRGSGINLGYRRQHLSNAGRGTSNPGINSDLFYVGFWIR